MGTVGLMSCWERVLDIVFNNLYIGIPYLDVTCRWWRKSELLFFWWSIIFLIVEKAACIIYEDRLDGMSNYLQWKVRMTVVLKENRQWTIVSTVVTPPIHLILLLWIFMR